MAEARISVSFTPAEFDLMRKSLAWVRNNQERVSRDTHTERKIRDEARKEAYLLGEILSRLS